MNPHTYKFWGGGAAPQNITYFYAGSHFYTDYSGNTIFLQQKTSYNQDTFEITQEVKLFSSDDLNTFNEVGSTSGSTVAGFLSGAEGITVKSAGIQSYTYGADSDNLFTIGKSFTGVTLNNNNYFQLSMPRTNDGISDANWTSPTQTYTLTAEITKAIDEHEEIGRDTTVTLTNLMSDDQFTISGISMDTGDGQMTTPFEGMGIKNATGAVGAEAFVGQTVDRVHPWGGVQTGNYNFYSEFPRSGVNYPCYSSSRAQGSFRVSEYYWAPADNGYVTASQGNWSIYLNKGGEGLWCTPRYVHTLDIAGTGFADPVQFAIAPSGQMKELDLQSGAGYLSGTYYMWDVNQASDTFAPPRHMGGTGSNACIIHTDGLVKFTTDRGQNWTIVDDNAGNRAAYDTLFEVLEAIRATQGTNWTFNWQGNCRTTPSGKILFMPSSNHLVYSEDGGQNWDWMYLSSSIYGMAHAHEKADGSIYVSSAGNWTFYKVHDGTNWLGSPSQSVGPIAQSYGNNAWNTGIFWYDEVGTTWYFLGNSGQGFAISGAEPVFTAAPTYDFVTNHGFPNVTANFDTNSNTRVIHYMGNNTWAWTNIHNNTIQWLDIANMTSVLYDVTGSDLTSDAIGDKWSALIPTGTYADPCVMGEFFIEKRYNSSNSTWTDYTTTRDQMAGGTDQTFVDPTFTFDFSHYDHAPNAIPQTSITNNGSGYSQTPTITLSPPDQPGGVQATVGSFQISNGAIYNIILDERGSGYTNPIIVTVTDSTGAGFACNPIPPRSTVATINVDDPDRVLRSVLGYGATVELMHNSSFLAINSQEMVTFAAADLNPLVFAGYYSSGSSFAPIDNKLENIYALSTNAGATLRSEASNGNYIFYAQKAYQHYMSKYELSTTGARTTTKHYIWDKFTNLPASFPRKPVTTSSTYDSTNPANTHIEDTQGTGYIVVDSLGTIPANNTYDSGKTYIVGYVEINGDGANTLTFDYFVHLATYDSVADKFTLRDQLHTDTHTLDASAGFSQQDVPVWYVSVATADNANTYAYRYGKNVNWAQEFLGYHYTTDAGATFNTFDPATDTAGGIPFYNDTLGVWVSYNATTTEISTSANFTGPWTVVATDLAGFLP